MDFIHVLTSLGLIQPRRLHKKSRKIPATQRACLAVENLETRLVPANNTINGYVFVDANNNGLFDAGESVIPNSSVALKDQNGAIVGQTQSDANGFYQFVVPQLTKGANATINQSITNWSKGLSLPQFDPALGTLTSVQITSAGTFLSDIAFESKDSGASVISATVSGNLTLNGPGVLSLLTSIMGANQSFSAGAFDGVIDFAGTSGHDFANGSASGSNSITLTDPSVLNSYIGLGSVSFTDSAVATSSASGAGNLITQISTQAGAQVNIVYTYTPSNYYTVVQTAEPAGFIDGKESANGAVLPNSINTDVIPIAFVGTSSFNNNFGELTPPSLSGYIYFDANNNGAKDPGEQGIAGATVALTGTSDSGPVAIVATTGADGSYSFTNLRPGTYTLKENTPTGYLDGKDALGSLGGTLTNDQVAGILVSAGATGINYNFGELLASSLAGFVYQDSNNDGQFDSSETGISGVTVTLKGTNDLGQSINVTTITGPGGGYGFVNLRPGTYSVTETQPAAYLDGKVTPGSTGGVAGANQISAIALGAGIGSAANNFGEVLAGSLAGIVYIDANKSGAKDSQEPGLGGVVITLTGTDDLGTGISKRATSAANGTYSFTGLRPGIYTVSAAQPTKYNPGKTSVGSLGGISATNQLSAITLQSGQSGQQYNFGEWVKPGVIGSSTSGLPPTNPGFLPSIDPGFLSKLQFLSNSAQIRQQATQLAFFVDGVFVVVLGRHADAGSLAAYTVGLLQGTVTPASLVASIWYSAEHLSFEVQQAYIAILGHPADAAGLRGFVGAMAAGMPLSVVENALFFSAEFQAKAPTTDLFIDFAFQYYLGRSPTLTELANWNDAITTGKATKAGLLAGLGNSPEGNSNMVNALFNQILGRAPDQASLGFYTAQLSSGRLSDAQLARLLLASGEFMTYSRKNAK